MSRSSRNQSCLGTHFKASVPTSKSPSPTMQPDRRTPPSRTPLDPATADKTRRCTPREDLHPTQQWSKEPENFALGNIVGEGAFGTVALRPEVASSMDYAIKVLEKKHITKKKARYVAREREILARLEHPFCVKLYCSFQDKEKVYFVFIYAQNGDLQGFVEKVGPLEEVCARFYSAEIVSALEYLHGLEIVHRDLTPRNILLNGDMHIQITDFGSAKILHSRGKKVRANSLVGTPAYMSPEILMEESVSKSSDLWALGCVIYYLVAGLHPFQARNLLLTFHRILKLAYDFPEQCSPNTEDLVRKLLVIDPTNRLGCEEMGSYGPLKEHPFFENITWDNLHLQTPPRVPGFLVCTSEGENDLGNSDNLQSQIPPSPSHSLAGGEPSSPQESPGCLGTLLNWMKSLWNWIWSVLKQIKGSSWRRSLMRTHAISCRQTFNIGKWHQVRN